MTISTLIYIHGQYGSPEEAEHYRALLPGCEVIGFDYKAQTPWEVEREFAEYFDTLAERGCGSIGIIANSIGAFYAMCALAGTGSTPRSRWRSWMGGFKEQCCGKRY